MKVLFIVLNKTEQLDALLLALSDAGIKGATIVHSTGMARALIGHGESPLISSLRLLLDPSREENRTIFTLVKDEQVPVVKQVLETVVGDLQAPDTAILFTIPVEDIEGVKF